MFSLRALVVLPLISHILCSKSSSIITGGPGALTSPLVAAASTNSCFKQSSSQTCSAEKSCAPGLFCSNSSCVCGKYLHHTVTCNGKILSVLTGYCSTFEEVNGTILVSVGYCIYSVISIYHKDGGIINLYNPLLSNTNDSICNGYHRTGLLCGECKPNHYPLVYSYSVACVTCPHARWNWFRYIMAAYLPLTVFYFVVLFFKMNTTTSHLFALVYYCQNLSLPVLAQSTLIAVDQIGNGSYLTIVRLVFSLFGIWNLDFFRSFYNSDLCLGIGILPTLALDYAIAVFPFFLMIITYLLITLYDRNYRVITLAWRPFRVLLSFFRRNWDIRTSVIDVFATFVLFSNIKFLSVSVNLLTPSKVCTFYQEKRAKCILNLYYAGNIRYFGPDHLPYAVLAIVVLAIFVFLPTAILALYPLKSFQIFLSHLPVRGHVINTFMDSFQGCYKDGGEPGTRDCRWFASVFFTIRIFLFLVYSLVNLQVFFSLAAMILTFHSTLLAVVRPYKHSASHLNLVNIIFLQLLNLLAITLSGSAVARVMSPSFMNGYFILGNILAVSPLLYGLAIALYWVYSHRLFGMDVVKRLKAWRGGYTQLLESQSGSLPDRIMNSGEYPRENLANFGSQLVLTTAATAAKY